MKPMETVDFLSLSVKAPVTICLLRAYFIFKAAIGFDMANKVQVSVGLQCCVSCIFPPCCFVLFLFFGPFSC